MDEVTIENGLMITPLARINLWTLYYDIEELVQPGDQVNYPEKVPTIPRTALTALLASQGVTNELALQITVDAIVEHGFLKLDNDRYRVTEQGVALYNSLNRRI